MRGVGVTLLSITWLCACGGSGSSASTDNASPTPSSGENLPPAFTAEQLRDALTVGTVMRYRVTELGKPPRIEEWKITAADAESCTLTVKVFAADGTTLVENKEPSTSKWTELESHGRFPPRLTARTESSFAVPAGRFDTWYFLVGAGSPSGVTRRFHFARALPGPPIWLEFTRAGRVETTMELLSRTSP